MAQPKDFYKQKHAALKELQRDIENIISRAEENMWYEEDAADSPDVAMYTKLIEKMKKAKMSLDFPLANVERMMHEKE